MASTRSKQSWLQRWRSICLRLFVYYVIYLSIFKCRPGSQLDSSSPALCTPLHSVFSFIQPYYSRYAENYVEAVTPYAKRAEISLRPALIKGDAAFQASWKYVKPHTDAATIKLRKLSAPVESSIKKFYGEKLGPKIQFVDSYFKDNLVPIYKTGVSQANKVQKTYIIPSIDAAWPYILRSYNSSARIAHVSARHVKTFGRISANHVISFSHKSWNWILNVVSPKVSAVYIDTIEPQLLKIQDRILRKPEVSEADLQTAESSEDLVDQDTDEDDTEESSITSETFLSKSTSYEQSTVVAEESQSSTKIYSESIESTPVHAADVTTSTSENTSGSSEDQFSLSHWRSVVNKTTSEGFDSFLSDVNQEKQRLLKDVTPSFTKQLQALQSAQRQSILTLRSLVDRINSTDPEEIEIVSPEFVQLEFRQQAENIRTSAGTVREAAQEFAQKVIDRTEQIRQDSVEVLDDFAEAALQEIGRKMISPSSVSTDSSGPGWKDWKEYRLLKALLLNSRQRVVDHDIPMEDVNKFLREIQETANVLAREAAEYLTALRAKADFLFQQRLKTQDAPDKLDNVEYYYEEEDEPEEAKVNDIPSEQKSENEESSEEIGVEDSDVEETDGEENDDEEEEGDEEEDDDEEDDDEVETLTQTITQTHVISATLASSP